MRKSPRDVALDSMQTRRGARVLVDARPLSYVFTGISVYLRSLLDELQDLDQYNHYYLLSHAKIHYHIKNPKWRKIEGRLNKRFVSSTWMQGAVYQLARRNKYDLFWGTRHHLPFTLPRYIKKVLNIHDLVHMEHPETMPWYNLTLEKIMMKQSVKRAHCIICDSRSTHSGLVKTYRTAHAKVFTVYPGAPSLAPLSNVDHVVEKVPPKYFLFVGTLEPRKNVIRLLKAFEKINPSHLGVHLVLVGAMGWKGADLSRLLKNYSCKASLKPMGYLPEEQLGYLYKNALCLVFPSIYEGFGFPILEAMRFGTPVITSKVSSMPEVAGDAALLVDPYSVDDIKNAMLRIVNDASLREKLSLYGKRRVRKFSWNTCAKKTLDVLKVALECKTCH
ncbi:MAG: glycosyltransferase family 4 protein [Deltaproteobacteria bacterium]|nr:glycosyltransferase family 4 protein [Deltaproteobacteria bacterium]MBW2301491.1 glycosyltransferase family 4 protein [Deltaproteobacteria bacterium]